MLYNEWSGPLSGYGFECHGCDVTFESQHVSVVHKEGCPIKCVREVCGWHMKGTRDGNMEIPSEWFGRVFGNRGMLLEPEVVRVPADAIDKIRVVNLPLPGDDAPPHLREWLDALVDEAKAVMRERGKKYGPGNIAEWGELGVLVRLSDKMARLREMQQNGSSASDFADESVEDTYIDIINYGIIALAWRRGLWPGSEKK